LIVLQQLSDAAVRDSLTAVFAGPEFTGVARQTVLARIVSWVGTWIMEFFRDLSRLTGGSRFLYYAVLVAAIGLVVAIVARAIYVARARGSFARGPGGRLSAAGSGAADDPWNVAQRLAAEGNYTGAAHALYGAILLSASRTGLVRLHEAKTIGDYVREIRARASAALLDPFREFARAYEYVVYGVGECDRTRYERLHGLATRILSHG
jgi:hypothetical protein